MANVHSPQPRKIKTLRALTSDGETARVARARATHTEQGARATPEYGPEPSGSASNRLVRAQREFGQRTTLHATAPHLSSQRKLGKLPVLPVPHSAHAVLDEGFHITTAKSRLAHRAAARNDGSKAVCSCRGERAHAPESCDRSPQCKRLPCEEPPCE